MTEDLSPEEIEVIREMRGCKGNYLAETHDPGCNHGYPPIPDLDEPGDTFNTRGLHVLRLRNEVARLNALGEWQ